VLTYRAPMGVAPQVPQHRGRSTEGRFGIDDPVGIEKRIDEGVPLSRIAQALSGAREVADAAHVGTTERGRRLPAKDPAKDLDGEEEAGVLRRNPLLVI